MGREAACYTWCSVICAWGLQLALRYCGRCIAACTCTYTLSCVGMSWPSMALHGSRCRVLRWPCGQASMRWRARLVAVQQHSLSCRYLRIQCMHVAAGRYVIRCVFFAACSIFQVQIDAFFVLPVLFAMQLGVSGALMTMRTHLALSSAETHSSKSVHCRS